VAGTLTVKAPRAAVGALQKMPSIGPDLQRIVDPAGNKAELGQFAAVMSITVPAACTTAVQHKITAVGSVVVSLSWIL